MLKFKKGISAVSVVVVLVLASIIAVVAFMFLTEEPPKHIVEIYATNKVNITNLDAKQIITDNNPVITTKDIVGYNKDTHMLFLSDEAIKKCKELKPAKKKSKIADRGSSILKKKGKKGSFIVAINGNPVMTGSLNTAGTELPQSLVLKDCTEGLRIYNLDDRIIDDVATRTKYQNQEKVLQKTFAEMKLLTNDVFTFSAVKGGKTYNTKKLWENRTKNIAENAKVAGIVTRLVYPKGSVYQSFSLKTSDKPYEVEITLDVDGDEATFYRKNFDVFLQNAEILFALIGNLDRVDFTLNYEKEIPFTTFMNNESKCCQKYKKTHPDKFYFVSSRFNKTGRLFEFYKEFEDVFHVEKRVLAKSAKKPLMKDKEKVAEKISNDIASTVEANIRKLEKLSDEQLVKDKIKNYEGYKEIIGMGEDALEHMLVEFKDGKGGGKKGKIMMLACRKILSLRDVNKNVYDTGIEWYKQYRMNQEVKIPNFRYKGKNKILKLLYKTNFSLSTLPKDGFMVKGFETIKTIKEENYLKVFVKIYASKYKLYASKDGSYLLDDLGGIITPYALTYRLTDSGNYKFLKYETATDNQDYYESLKELCRMPKSKKPISGLADSIMNSNDDNVIKVEKDNLREMLHRNGIGNAREYDDNGNIVFDYIDLEFVKN